eukprot:TRINITY_DN38051_c0_g1_i1.p1 TRINITY_DN38051_c0_g1~~TRINITY_DN38051_c0_g1_i1.p1  ORF type:complete len:604 (-),score=99.27 TRINITY_DN38051_c0_g1_i1:912-2723(-)
MPAPRELLGAILRNSANTGPKEKKRTVLNLPRGRLQSFGDLGSRDDPRLRRRDEGAASQTSKASHRRVAVLRAATQERQAVILKPAGPRPAVAQQTKPTAASSDEERDGTRPNCKGDRRRRVERASSPSSPSRSASIGSNPEPPKRSKKKPRQTKSSKPAAVSAGKPRRRPKEATALRQKAKSSAESRRKSSSCRDERPKVRQVTNKRLLTPTAQQSKQAKQETKDIRIGELTASRSDVAKPLGKSTEATPKKENAHGSPHRLSVFWGDTNAVRQQSIPTPQLVDPFWGGLQAAVPPTSEPVADIFGPPASVTTLATPPADATVGPQTSGACEKMLHGSFASEGHKQVEDVMEAAEAGTNTWDPRELSVSPMTSCEDLDAKRRHTSSLVGKGKRKERRRVKKLDSKRQRRRRSIMPPEAWEVCEISTASAIRGPICIPAATEIIEVDSDLEVIQASEAEGDMEAEDPFAYQRPQRSSKSTVTLKSFKPVRPKATWKQGQPRLLKPPIVVHQIPMHQTTQYCLPSWLRLRCRLMNLWRHGQAPLRPAGGLLRRLCSKPRSGFLTDGKRLHMSNRCKAALSVLRRYPSRACRRLLMNLAMQMTLL